MTSILQSVQFRSNIQYDECILTMVTCSAFFVEMYII